MNSKFFSSTPLITILFFLFNSCTQDQKQTVTSERSNLKIVSDIKADRKVKTIVPTNPKPKTLYFPSDLSGSVRLSKIFKIDSLTILETRTEGIIGEISKIKINNGRIFVLDRKISKGVYAFNRAGKLLFSINKQGNGPGELGQPSDFTFSNNHILILNNRHEILSYNISNGKFIEKITIPFAASGLSSIKNSEIVYFYNTGDNLHTNYDFNLIQLNLVSKTFEARSFPKSEYNFRFSAYSNFYSSSYGTYFFKNYDMNIYKLDNDKVAKQDSLNFGSQQPPFNYLNDIAKDRAGLKKLLASNYVFNITQVLENEFYQSIMYVYKKHTHVYILDKKHNRSLNYLKFEDDRFLGSLSTIPMEFIGNKIIFYIEPNKLKNSLKFVDHERQQAGKTEIDPWLNYLHSISEKVSSDSNPIIAYLSLK